MATVRGDLGGFTNRDAESSTGLFVTWRSLVLCAGLATWALQGLQLPGSCQQVSGYLTVIRQGVTVWPRHRSSELRSEEAQWKERGSLTPGIQGATAALWDGKESRAEVGPIRLWQRPEVTGVKATSGWEMA